VRDEELTAAIRDARERANARVPQGPLGLDGVTAPDLMPLVYARDSAEAKVAAIGTVNPRPAGLKNAIIQRVKRLVARALDWHVREQIEFNRASMACVQASLEAMSELSRGLAALAAHFQRLREEVAAEAAVYQAEASELKDIRKHWAEWRTGFEERRAASEIHMLRTISELQGAFQHRVTLMDQNFRESLKHQHAEYLSALERNTLDVQKRLWHDLEQIRADYEKLIHTELRVLRQKQFASGAAAGPSAGNAPDPAGSPDFAIDWMHFAGRFRGSEDRIREQQRRHVERFQGTAGEILDLGCGRGEFLEAVREAGLTARGIDLSEECVALCRAKGLAAERADLFAHLASLPDRSLGGAFCCQVVEHLAPGRVPRLVQLLAAKLRSGALAILETPNPECLAIFATHFYLDPTHTRPVPAALLRFYLEEAGFGNIEVERLAPAAESLPALNDLPSSVREALFGGLDYAILARKL
jgi:O-antigen chain-terminating methyltransferase